MIYIYIYIYIYNNIRLNAAYGRPVMHIACAYGKQRLHKVLMCDCITNTFYLMIILVSGDGLDIKELIYAIIRNFILYFDWFEHIYCRHLYIFMCIRCRVRDPAEKCL